MVRGETQHLFLGGAGEAEISASLERICVALMNTAHIQKGGTQNAESEAIVSLVIRNSASV